MAVETNHSCGKCGAWNLVNKAVLTIVEATDDKGKKYRLMAYYCKECGELNIVQVDDENTLHILDRVTREAVGMYRKIKEKKKITNVEVNKSKVLNKRLDRERKKLSKKIKDVQLRDKNNQIINKNS